MINRKIKFRAWDKKEKRMIDLNSLEIYNDLDRAGLYCLDEVLNNKDLEIMEYTGLKDKNGNEIYEGDIFESTHESRGNRKVRYIIRFGKAEVSTDYDLIFDYNGFYFEEIDELHTNIPIHWDSLEKDVGFKRIGNIFENPELLEKIRRDEG